MIQQKANEFPPVKEALKVDSESSASLTYTDNTGTKMLASYQSLDKLGWVLVAQQPIQEAFSSLRKLLKLNIIILLAAGLAAGIAAWKLADNFTAPILEIVEAMRKKAEGNLAVRLDLKRKDELGKLTEAFNKETKNQRIIIEQLKDLIEDLTSYSEELSASSEEGKAAIESSNQQIESMMAGINQISNTTQEVTGLAENNDQVRESAEELNAMSREVTESAQELSRMAQELENLIAEFDL